MTLKEIWNDADVLWGLAIKLLIFGLTCKIIAVILGIIIVIKK